jgi:hypothetical protein
MAGTMIGQDEKATGSRARAIAVFAKRGAKKSRAQKSPA